ncbi:hypothetical protein HDU97_007142 [Phlyctochytrium planicorne]|nr:hypothetical protein HDU97_007142 [Phlyctochytrium planicorne]
MVIPVVDISKYIETKDEEEAKRASEEIKYACERIGCFYLTGLDSILSKEKLLQVHAVSRRFFEETSLEQKQKLLDHNLIGRGYIPFETENVSAFMGRPNLPHDPLEKFAIGPPYACPAGTDDSNKATWWASNVWPEVPAEFQSLLEEYYMAMLKTSQSLMTLFSVALDMPKDYVGARFDLAQNQFLTKEAGSIKISSPHRCLPVHTADAGCSLQKQRSTSQRQTGKLDIR